MERLKNISNLINTASLIIGIIIQEFLTDYIKKEKIIGDSPISFIISVITILIIFVIFQLILNELVNNKNLRRMVLKDHFIEGMWIEIVFDNETNSKISIGIKNIIYRNDTFIYEGDNYSIDDFKHIGSYCSSSVSFLYPYVNYTYTYDKNDSFFKKEGIGRVKFVKRQNSFPLIHNGFFIDLELKKKYTYVAWKITDKKQIKNIENPATFKDIVKEYILKMDTSIQVD